MKVAIPQLRDSIAPCFEVARLFQIATVLRSQITSCQKVECSAPEGHKRVRLLQVHDVNLLICNGIKSHFQGMLEVSGITVIKNVCSSCDDALTRFISGELSPKQSDLDDGSELRPVSHCELTYWTRKLFEKGGYVVSPTSKEDHLLVDLVAEICCPVCGRNIKVAICCGSHTYRRTQEIIEFHHSTQSEFNARVYVCPAVTTVTQCCREYGIQHLDPDMHEINSVPTPPKILPILTGPVQEHERASMIARGN